MSLKSLDKKAGKLSWLDIQLIKLSAVGFVLTVAKLWIPLLSLSWYWYAIIFILAGIKPLFKVLKK